MNDEHTNPLAYTSLVHDPKWKKVIDYCPYCLCEHTLSVYRNLEEGIQVSYCATSDETFNTFIPSGE